MADCSVLTSCYCMKDPGYAATHVACSGMTRLRRAAKRQTRHPAQRERSKLLLQNLKVRRMRIATRSLLTNLMINFGAKGEIMNPLKCVASYFIQQKLLNNLLQRYMAIRVEGNWHVFMGTVSYGERPCSIEAMSTLQSFSNQAILARKRYRQK